MRAFQLAGRHVVVIGGSSGIGAEAARQCAAAGASVSICARREDRLTEVLTSLEGPGPHRHAVLDVVDLSAIDACVKGFVEAGGPIGGLIYAAGNSQILPLSVLSCDAFERILSVNLTGAIFATKAACRYAAHEGMSVVWMSSIAARRSMSPGMTAYAAAKGALEAAVTTLALELARRRIRINVIAPGAIDTDIWKSASVDPEHAQRVFSRAPLGPGEPADVALGCVYLLSNASRWVTGTVLLIDGGMLVS